jgi:vanillate O-demethylase ferredoxin subunit
MQERLRVRVTRIWDEAVDARAFELHALEGETLPEFTAGAHIGIATPGGHIRQYSLCGAPHEKERYQICVLLADDSCGGSRSMHMDVAVGQMLEIGGPRNLFECTPSDAPSILIAGGIGITPILSMALALEAQGRSFEIHYASRSRRHAAFLDTLKRFGDKVHLYTPEAAGSRLQLDTLFQRHAAIAHFYVCGPERLISAALDAALTAGVPLDRVHFERFAAKHGTTGVGLLPSMGTDFELFLARSLRTVTVDRTATLIQAIRSAGVQISTSCEQGVCGTCMTTVLEGDVDHRDGYLSDEEKRAGNVIIPCCSTARSTRLVLDL